MKDFSRVPLSAVWGVVLWLILVLGCAGSSTHTRASPELTTEHRNAINTALRAKKYPSPSLEITDDGWLVATFELTRMPPDGLQGFASDSVITIREAMLPFHAVQYYRVTLNGPSPGTGLIRRYGSARFVEGGQVEWEPAR